MRKKKNQKEQQNEILQYATENQPYRNEELICVKCFHRGIHIWPQSTLLRDLECPTCNKSGALILTGEDLTDVTNY
jgi:hypothetical protein